MKRILVVGAGCTGSCVAAQLRTLFGDSVSIEVWEWSRGVGGRMTSTRHESLVETLRADTGASMISVDMADVASAALIKTFVQADILRQVDPELLSKTPLRPRGGSWQHFAAVSGGLNSALKFLLEQGNIKTCFERRAKAINLKGQMWEVCPYEGPSDKFHAVVIAVEACGSGTDHVHQIRGGWQRLIDPESEAHLRKELYDHRFGVALFLAPEYREHCESLFGPSVFEKEVNDDMIHLIQYQSRKTSAIGGLQSNSPVVVAHCTLEYSSRDLGVGKNRRLEFVTNRIIYQYLLIPANIKVNTVVLGSKVINWRTCEVVKPLTRSSSTFPMCLPLSQQPALVLAGDYFTQSNFTGCAASARDAAAAVFAALQGSPTTELDKPVRDDEASDDRTHSRRWIAKRTAGAAVIKEMKHAAECGGRLEDSLPDERRQERWRRKGGGKGKGTKQIGDAIGVAETEYPAELGGRRDNALPGEPRQDRWRGKEGRKGKGSKGY